MCIKNNLPGAVERACHVNRRLRATRATRSSARSCQKKAGELLLREIASLSLNSVMLKYGEIFAGDQLNWICEIIELEFLQFDLCFFWAAGLGTKQTLTFADRTRVIFRFFGW